MESKVRIILGFLLVSFAVYQVECASLTHHFRSVRDVELPPSLNTSTTDPAVTKNDHISTTVPTSTQDNTTVNKIESKTEDLAENESVKSSAEETLPDPKEKPIVSRGTVKFQSEDKKSNKENETKESSKEETVANKNEEPKATGRSLNIDIDKYVSAEFHNKNNVYSLPTSPEIEKYLVPDSQDFSDDTTKSSLPLKPFTSRTTSNEFNFDLTTPQSNIFDPKFQLLVDGIKQNLDELHTDPFKHETEKTNLDNDTTSNYDISKLIDNYNNSDNETDVTLQTKEYKNIDLKSDKNKGNKDVESGQSVNYESTNLKTRTFGEKPENSDVPAINKIPNNQEVKSVDNEKQETKTESQYSVTTLKPSTTTFTPSKKPRFQVSLRNNTIETTAPDSEIKPKSIKHFSYESSSLDPLYEAEKVTYTKPVYENAINISKRGSTKFIGANEDSNISTTPSFMDYDNKNFTIPPTATAWTLASLKDVPTTVSNVTDEQNSQENNLVKIQVNPPTTVPSSTENDLTSTTKIYKNSSSNDDYDDISTSTEDSTTSFEDLTERQSTTDNSKEIDTSTLSNEFSTTTAWPEESTEKTTDLTSTVTEMDNYSTTEEMTTEIYTTTESTTIEPETESVELTTVFISTTNSIKFINSKTEGENELYTTLKTVSENVSENIEDISNTSNPNINNIFESTTTKFQRMSSTRAPNLDEEDIDNNSGDADNDYSEIMKKEKNSTDVNDPEIEIVPIDTEQGSRTTWRPNDEVTTQKLNETTTVMSIDKDQKSILANSNDGENTTLDTTSSTDMLSHDESPDESNSGMIAAIAISSVGGVCLILLAGLLLIMRKRQKRVTYGQRCRPVSLDAYSLDNVSVYNSVRRKGVLRASKRSYGNPAFDDPVSISHQMNFQSLVKFAEDTEGMSTEFDEIPQVTARANEVPPGCETKNRYANVIPLPETRVFLKGSDNDPHSDYINANYVTGPKNTRGYYIACQAPMQNTVDDFWRMVWEQQSRVVLMLTNLYENGIEKCADYLPPSEVLDCHRLFGDFQITLKKREVKEKYIISSLQLKNMVSNSWREVTHLWYLGWPERGVPTEANSLIAFLIEARSHLKAASNNNSTNDKTSESSNIYISNAAAGSGRGGPDGGPMVVHCSPGTGRTGTAIACDVAIRDFELTRAVDVPKIVYRVRRDRASAVQTRDQYAFIYKVISLYATKLTGGALDSI